MMSELVSLTGEVRIDDMYSAELSFGASTGSGVSALETAPAPVGVPEAERRPALRSVLNRPDMPPGTDPVCVGAGGGG